MAEKQKVALITGITGQDGSFQAEFLLSLYTPPALSARASANFPSRGSPFLPSRISPFKIRIIFSPL